MRHLRILCHLTLPSYTGQVFRKELWEAGVLKEVHRDDIFGDLEEIAGTHRQVWRQQLLLCLVLTA